MKIKKFEQFIKEGIRLIPVDLADEFIKLYDSGEIKGMNWDDFFGKFNVKGTDFAVGSIYKQVSEKRPDIIEPSEPDL